VLARLAAHVDKLGHRRRRFAFDVLLKGSDGDVSDTDGGHSLSLRNAGLLCCFTLRSWKTSDGAVIGFGRTPALGIELLKQLAAATNRPRLNAISVLAQRVVVSLLCVARKRIRLVSGTASAAGS
jgi:hypothetical protein